MEIKAWQERATRGRVVSPLLSVEEGKDVFAGHEALLHVAQLQVVHLEHVLLLFLLQGERKRRAGLNLGLERICFMYLFLEVDLVG